MSVTTAGSNRRRGTLKTNTRSPDAQAFISNVVRALGGAAITIALVVVVLNEVFTLNIVANSSGPFSTSTVTGPMGGALALLALAILVGGARIVMSQMGGSGGL